MTYLQISKQQARYSLGILRLYRNEQGTVHVFKG